MKNHEIGQTEYKTDKQLAKEEKAKLRAERDRQKSDLAITISATIFEIKKLCKGRPPEWVINGDHLAAIDYKNVISKTVNRHFSESTKTSVDALQKRLDSYRLVLAKLNGSYRESKQPRK